jgi:hypothetical protein
LFWNLGQSKYGLAAKAMADRRMKTGKAVNGGKKAVKGSQWVNVKKHYEASRM